MNDTNLKYRISQSLSRFSQGSLRENGIELLNTLGYRSERQVELEPNTFDGLVDIHPPFSEINHDKAMVNDWISVDVLFQLTGEDIKHISQGHLSLRMSKLLITRSSSRIFF